MALKDTIPPTTDRVEMNTAPEVNARIHREIEQDVASVEGADAAEITGRIQELEREWDIERVLEANASVIILLSVVLGFFVNRKWLIFPAVVATFLLQHAVQGWCPPLVPWRRAGVRSQKEINEEIIALRLLRGDFKPTNKAADAVAQATDNQ